MISFFSDDPFCFIFDVYGWFSCCYDVILGVNFFSFFFGWFYQTVLYNTNSFFVGIVSIFQEEHKTMKEFKNDLFCRCCLNQCTMDDIKSFCMSDWWDMKNKTILTRQNNAGLLIRLHIEFKQVNRISNFFLLRFTDKNYISLLFLM